MSELRDRLEQVLVKPAKTADDAERAAKAAEALAAYLRLEQSVAALLDGPEVAGRGIVSGSLAGRTVHEAARVVLEQAGAPLHARELGRRMKAGGWTHKRTRRANDDQIVYQLAARLPRYPDVFVRVAPNTFGLVAWGTPSERPKPRVGLFSGQGKPTGREIGEQAGDAAGAGPWRSS